MTDLSESWNLRPQPQRKTRNHQNRYGTTGTSVLPCVRAAPGTAPQRLGSQATGTERHASGQGSRRSLTFARAGPPRVCTARACVHPAVPPCGRRGIRVGPLPARGAAAGTRVCACQGHCLLPVLLMPARGHFSAAVLRHRTGRAALWQGDRLPLRPAARLTGPGGEHHLCACIARRSCGVCMARMWQQSSSRWRR